MSVANDSADAEGESKRSLKSTNNPADEKESLKQLPPLQSYALMREKGDSPNTKVIKAGFAPSRVKLDAAQVLPCLRHSQPGIGYYGRVRERVANNHRTVELWSPADLTAERSCTLLLAPSSELTRHYYSSQPTPDESQGPKPKVVAVPNCGHFPFSRIVYPNLIGQSGGQPIVRGSGARGPLVAHSAGGAFVLRHKVRQRAGCLARILDSQSTSEAAVRRAVSRGK